MKQEQEPAVRVLPTTIDPDGSWHVTVIVGADVAKKGGGNSVEALAYALNETLLGDEEYILLVARRSERIKGAVEVVRCHECYQPLTPRREANHGASAEQSGGVRLI